MKIKGTVTFVATLAIVITALAGCSRSTTTVPAADGSQSAADGSQSAADGSQSAADGSSPVGGDSGTSFSPSNQPACDDIVTQCNDGKDNDGDNLIDALDPECVGPCDNDEASFKTGVPGDNIDACKQDCFFDGNSGQGDDGCEWNLKCDPTNPGANLANACPYDPDFTQCPESQTEECKRKCGSLTPHGCDCFGCCQVTSKGRIHNIYLGSPDPECSLENLDRCVTCTFSQDCFEPCGECELCQGKTFADIPPHCFSDPHADAGPPTDAGSTDAAPPTECKPALLPACDFNRKRCCTSDDCSTRSYCQTGCCLSLSF